MSPDARPRLVHARLRRRGSDTWLLAPERGFVLRGSASAILALVDGARTCAEIADVLAARHLGTRADIDRDVRWLLDALAARGVVVAT
jgi:coenzyme PQQ biosynthesis protein PqqD